MIVMNKDHTHKIVSWLGHAGLLPFVVAAVLIWYDYSLFSIDTFRAFYIYSIMIYAFLCGSWWGMAFGTDNIKQAMILWLSSNILFVIAFLVTILSAPSYALLVMTLGYIALLLAELKFSAIPIDNAYRRMRIVLTTVVVASHLSILAAISGW